MIPRDPRRAILTLVSKAFGELALIQQIRSGWGGTVRGQHTRLGIGDDCALLRPARGHDLAVTTDLLLENRHFRRDWHSAASAGHRALARGLSDLAAMGATPLAAFLSLALPPTQLATPAGRRWVKSFFAGLRDLGARYRVGLAGGDTSASPCDLILADIILVGSVPTDCGLRRSGARAGDLLYVTGALGGAAAELRTLATRTRPSSARPSLAHPNPHPQLFPQPRVAVGRSLLRRQFAHAAIDLSDGLSSDLAHLCRASGLAGEVDEAAIPLHPLAFRAATSIHEARTLALNGGEDYELLFAAAPEARVPRTIAGVPVTRIGRLLPGKGLTLIAADGTRGPLISGGWEHLTRST